MASYPGPKVHRPSRRHLGKNQYPTSNSVSAVVSSTGTTNATITFARPVVVTGTIPLTVASLTLVSQVQTSPTVVSQTWSAAVTTHAYNLPSGAANVASYQGGQVIGAAGTFP